MHNQVLLLLLLSSKSELTLFFDQPVCWPEHARILSENAEILLILKALKKLIKMINSYRQCY